MRPVITKPYQAPAVLEALAAVMQPTSYVSSSETAFLILLHRSDLRACFLPEEAP